MRISAKPLLTHVLCGDMVNLKAELEVRSLHEKMDLLLKEQIKTLYAIQEKQFNLLNELCIKMDGLCENIAAKKN